MLLNVYWFEGVECLQTIYKKNRTKMKLVPLSFLTIIIEICIYHNDLVQIENWTSRGSQRIWEKNEENVMKKFKRKNEGKGKWKIDLKSMNYF